MKIRTAKPIIWVAMKLQQSAITVSKIAAIFIGIEVIPFTEITYLS